MKKVTFITKYGTGSREIRIKKLLGNNQISALFFKKDDSAMLSLSGIELPRISLSFIVVKIFTKVAAGILIFLKLSAYK